jgi:lactate 2-monooxygenase
LDCIGACIDAARFLPRDRSADYGADGIYCSNRGSRQADGEFPPLDALPAVVEAADGTPVLFDSGVRGGSDAAKALALGRTIVGAVAIYLCRRRRLVQLCDILAELDLLMAVDGFHTIADLRAAGAQRI